METLLIILMLTQVLAPVQPPETILVRVANDTHCADATSFHWQWMSFKDYVKGVLPSEMSRYWPMDTLKAGALAAKMFGWVQYEKRGFVYGCDWDQAYVGDYRTPRTDAAVDAIWDYTIFNEEGELYKTYYNASIRGCELAKQWRQCMAQWRAADDGAAGMMWYGIIHKYYKGAVIFDEETIYQIQTWRYEVLCAHTGCIFPE